MNIASNYGAEFNASAVAKAGIQAKMKLGDLFEIECRDKNGKFKWKDTIRNLVVNTGLDDVLTQYLKGSAYTAAHYIGLTGTVPSVAAADTMAVHPGWTEVTAYDEANRQTMQWGAVAGQSVDNSASKATFTISTDSTVLGGAFLSTNATKGGSTGTLYAGGTFTAGDKTLDDNDVIYATVTAEAAT